MLAEIGISQPYAFKLMRIGKRFPNHSNWNDLPSSIAALYELSRMDPSDIEHGIETGHITPDMTIRDAKRYGTTRERSRHPFRTSAKTLNYLSG